MPYYWRRPYYQRRRRFWRRFRGPFRRRWRRRWRKRYRVRRKLPNIKIKQYQPETIRKCTIKGIQPIFIANGKRLGNNFRQYEHSYIPEHGPGGGGFSITKYSLDALYEQHDLVRNWWTNTNRDLPLCRYTGCKLKCYKSDDVDYVITIFTCYPMLATQHLYTSCQPSIQLMNPHSYIIPCKKTNPKRKNYKIIKVPPPAQLTNKWYFTKDLAKTGLLLYTAAACSLDHYYINPYSESNNFSFTSLNTKYINMINYQQPGSHGYYFWKEGTNQKLLWAAHTATINMNVEDIKIGDLCLLANSTYHQSGKTMNETGQNPTDYIKYTNYKNWGNPFHQSNLRDNDYRLLVTTKPLDTLITQTTYPTKDSKLKVADFTFVTEPLLIRCRYQPDKDTGNKNILYIKSNVRDETGYTPPTSENLQIFGFPLWLLTFGWLDWIRKANIVVHLDRNYTIIIKSDQINPTLDYYLPLDEDFLNDKSPYETESHVVTDSDSINWFPQVTFQHQTLEHFTQTGPGIAKLGSKKSVEAKLEYRFYFKWGGCPPKMEKITDPTTLPVYPVPNNNESIYSLQNPEINPSTFLYNFDVRQDIITKTAAKRLKKDYQTATTLFTDAGGKLQPPVALSQEETQTSSEGEEDSEKEEETLLIRLNQLKRKRRRIQLKLLQLMNLQ
nr:MAG: ORF1 [TTV-like mini virus]